MQPVQFTSNEVTHHVMIINVIMLPGPNIIEVSELVYSGANSVYTHTALWENEEYLVVNFGATDQIVSLEFYTWLTANATRI